MEAFLVSTLVVAVGEIGDKTQLLALILAARFKRPLPIIAGILVATVLNHTVAGLVGGWVRSIASPDALRWGLGLSFLAIAAWALVPDKIDAGEDTAHGKYGIFLTTALAFFLAEIGDKTQVATVMLAAKYDNLFYVVAGTTLGMLVADVPAVLLGKMASPRIPMKLVRLVAAGLFALLGIAALLGGGALPAL